MDRQRRDERCMEPDEVVNVEELAPRESVVDDGKGELNSMAGTGIIRFDRSRRRFLQLTGLSLAGLMLPAYFWKEAAAQDVPGRVRNDRAAAWALRDVGAKVVTHVPATGVTAIFDAYNELAGTKPAYAFNEEVAFTMAYGAAVAGVRSAALLKSHGLAKAANSVIDSLTLGTTAGFVVVVLDDPFGRHSDNIFGLEDFLKGTGIPFKKAGRDTVYGDLIECFAWSEELRTPVALFVDSENTSKETICNRSILQPTTAKYHRDPLRHVLCPPLAVYQRKVMDARLSRTDWRTIPEPAPPRVPDRLPPAWRSGVSRLIPLFEVFRELRPRIPIVSGDTGLSVLYAFAPFDCIDVCSYYGGSIPLAIGFYLAGFRRAWAVTGDYAFLAAGHMGLIEAKARQVPLKVLVIDNGCAMATGGQPVAEGVFEQVVGGWAPFVSRIDNPRDTSAVRSVLSRANESDRLEIVVARFRG
jgi:TPP-dependent indolepyruvate ferredoxin oxidoreductase alpha subunit